MVKYYEKLPTCQYKYEPLDVEEYPIIEFACDELTIKNSTFCVFHDKDHYAEHKCEAAQRFKDKFKKLKDGEPMICIGYYLPDIPFARYLEEIGSNRYIYFNRATFYEAANFSDASFDMEVDFKGAQFNEQQLADFSRAHFDREAYFTEAIFSKEANFESATFTEGADFTRAKFLDEVYFIRKNKFTGKTVFKYTLFEKPNKVTFNNSNLSNVSFADSDITRIRFGDGITWRREENGVIAIIEEEWLERKSQGEPVEKEEDMSLDLVLSVYRNLRENFEFRLRYDEAGKLFIREMELKRKYREDPLLETGDVSPLINLQSGAIRRHAMESLTALSKYLGCYDRRQEIRKRHSLHWTSGDESIKSLERFFNPDLTLDNINAQIRQMITNTPMQIAHIIRFACLTGLRPREVIESVKLINRQETLGNYYNQNRQALEHFRFPDIFLRHTKKAYISFVTQEILQLVRFERNARMITYNIIRKRLNQAGLSVQLSLCRKPFASRLRQSAGIQPRL